ncbi:hypothetical protein [Streptomyces sp. NPDC048496]|uniref:hypothetical protein n=1 Tax=Streptomyces sp. NPDC048496 TaxID=3365558 RepID=UPI00371ACD7F
MGLGSDPYTSNRYAFTGGNPTSFIELDGHLPCAGGIKDVCGGGSAMTSLFLAPSKPASGGGYTEGSPSEPKVTYDDDFPYDPNSKPTAGDYVSWNKWKAKTIGGGPARLARLLR